MRRPLKYRAALLAAAYLGVAGCEVGPSFRVPPAPSDASYHPPAGQGATREASPQSFAPGAQVSAQWWTLFHSDALDALVKQAIAGSWSLDSARARMVQAQAAVGAAASSLWPQLSVSASAAREKLTAASFGLPPGALALPPNFNLLQVGPVASYSLDLFGGTRRRIEQAQALEQVQREGVRAAYLTLSGNTVLEALELATLRAQAQSVSTLIEFDRRNLDLVQKASQVGTLAAGDVVTAQTQLAQDQALQPPLDQALVGTAHALAELLGRAPDEWLPPTLELAGLTLPMQVPLTLPSQLVHQRPDILAAEAQLHAASAQIGVATAALYPDISLSAFINGSSLNGGNLFDPANIAWSIAAGLTQPLFDAHRRRFEQREALAAYRASAADYQHTVLAAFRQVADLLQALDHDAKLLAAEKRALDSALQAVQLQRAGLAAGGTGILSLIDAQRQYAQAAMQYVHAQGQRYQDTAQLLVAMGGSWWPADESDAVGGSVVR